MNGFALMAVDLMVEYLQDTKKVAVDVNGKTIYGAKIIVKSGFRKELGDKLIKAMRECQNYQERS